MDVKPIDVEARGMLFDGLAAGPAAGELVVLLHGFPQSAEIWRPALQSLGAAGFRAVALNQRGYTRGAMPEGVAAYSVDELVEDVRGIIAALGHTQAHIVGHDWGGAVAWALAATAPQWCISLVSISTPHTAALRDALRRWPQRGRMLYIPVLRLPFVAEALFMAGDGRLAVEALAGTGLSRSSARRDVTRLRELGATGALNWYRAIDRASLRQTDAVDVPAMYVWSDGDPAFTREAAELTERYTRGPYHFVELRGATHWIPEQHWDDVADLVTSHLRSG